MKIEKLICKSLKVKSLRDRLNGLERLPPVPRNLSKPLSRRQKVIKYAKNLDYVTKM